MPAQITPVSGWKQQACVGLLNEFVELKFISSFSTFNYTPNKIIDWLVKVSGSQKLVVVLTAFIICVLYLLTVSPCMLVSHFPSNGIFMVGMMAFKLAFCLLKGKVDLC